MKTVLEKRIDGLKASKTEAEYKVCLEALKQTLIDSGADSHILKKASVLSNYMENAFSQADTLSNMEAAKTRLISYLAEQIPNSLYGNMTMETKLLCLQKTLEKFDLFMDALFEKTPHGRATIEKTVLKSLQIKNEYDVQHILYALLKPLFPEARTEVTEDTGFSSVRADIWIKDISTVIEIKCSRDSMTVKKLTEEIAADMVHYQAEHIFFFLYDKKKIIDNPYTFIDTYQKQMDGKDIHITIHQPKNL